MRSDDATTREPQVGAVVTIPGDNCSPYTLTGGGWVDKYGGEDGNVYVSGLDVWASVLDHIATLAAEVERVKGEAEESRANLLLQTICRLPSVLTTDDWQDFLEEHRHEWLNDDRAFGGWVSQRLSVAIATARADALREVREKVENLERFTDTTHWGESAMECADDGNWIDRDDVLVLLDATRGPHE